MAKLSSLGDPDIIKFSELPSASAIVGTEIIPVVQGSTSSRITIGDLFKWSMSIGTVAAPKTMTFVPNATSAEITIGNGALNFNRTHITDAAQIRWNRGGDEIWGYGFDWISDDLVIAYDGLTNKDVMRLAPGGMVKIGQASSPAACAANLTLTSHAANGTTGILGVVSETNSGTTGTSFILFIANDGKIKIGGSDNPAEILDVTGNVKVTSGVYVAPVGTVDAPTYTFVGRTDAGLISSADHRVAVVLSGAAHLEVSVGQINICQNNLANVLQMTGYRCYLNAPTGTGAGRAPLKIGAATVMVTPEAGAIESDGTHLWWTDDGGTRRQLDN